MDQHSSQLKVCPFEVETRCLDGLLETSQVYPFVFLERDYSNPGVYVERKCLNARPALQLPLYGTCSYGSGHATDSKVGNGTLVFCKCRRLGFPALAGLATRSQGEEK